MTIITIIDVNFSLSLKMDTGTDFRYFEHALITAINIQNGYPFLAIDSPVELSAFYNVFLECIAAFTKSGRGEYQAAFKDSDFTALPYTSLDHDATRVLPA